MSFVVVLLALSTPAGASASPYGAVAAGWNRYGQLDNGEISEISPVPRPVVGVGEIQALAKGAAFSLALLKNGTVLAWGENQYGQLGNGTTTNSATPVTVKGLTEVSAISAGSYHALALLKNGTVVAWGRNSDGQLGDGGTTNKDEPVAVSELREVKAIVAGGLHSLALLNAGTVKAWGDNEEGQLGNGGGGEGAKSSAPVAVSGLTNVTAIAAGAGHSTALLSTGAVKDWGDNQDGVIGDGHDTGPETCKEFFVLPCARVPIEVVGLSSVTAIADGFTASYAITSAGAVKAWGSNSRAELGDGTNTGPELCTKNEETTETLPCSTKPVAVSGLTSGVSTVAGGEYFAAALLTSGKVDAWGADGRGELGLGTSTGPESCTLEAGSEACSKSSVEVPGLSGVGGLGSGPDGGMLLAFGAAFRVGEKPPQPSPEELFGTENPGDPTIQRACAGKPVNCATGNETVAQTDVAIGGRGVGLNLVRTYNALGAVATKTPEPFGRGWSSSYTDHLVLDAEAETLTVVQANGSTAVFKGKPGTVGTYAAPTWGQAKLALNSEHTYVYMLPNQEAYSFNEEGVLQKETDRDGNATTFTYNEAKQLETVTDPAGRKLTFGYTEGFVTSIKDPMGYVTKYAYEGGNLASVTEPGEAAPRWQFAYDGTHRLTKLTDGRGGKTTIEYNEANQVTLETDPSERQLSFEYSPQQTTITNKATGVVTDETFTEGGEPLSITRGVNTTSQTTESMGYDEAGELIISWDGRGRRTIHQYNENGDRTSTVDPDGNETKWGYNGTHDVTSMTTPKGETTTIKRDSHGNPEAEERPAPGGTTQITKYKYNSLGERESKTDPLEHTWKYEYDSQGNRTAETDPEGNKRTWKYDEDSRETAIVSPRGHAEGAEEAKYTTTIERDAQGRPIKVTEPLGHETKYTYDANGNVESRTDPNGDKTKYTYDADNELTKTEEPNGTVTETEYDGAGQVISQTDGNKHTTKYTRNALEQITEVEDPLKHKTTKKYNGDGQVTVVTDPAKRTTTNTYDAAGRLVEITYSESGTHSVEYEYDADGDRTKMIDGTGTTTNTYDALDRLTETKDGHGDVVKYEYNLGNKQTKITYPNGKAITRVFDKDGRLERVTDWLEHATSFKYNPESAVAATVFPSGTSNEDKYTYDEADRLSEVKMTKGAETLASLAYARDSDGQVKTAISKGLPGEEKPSYEYDANNRLTKGAGITYEYDNGNNPTKTGSSTNAFNAGDELEKGTSATYSYNELGERTKRTPTSGAATTYGYDQAGDLVSATRPKEGKIAELKDTYTYDGTGLRMSQTISSTTTNLAWGTSETVPLLLNDGANSYIYGPNGLPVEQIATGGTTLYLHHDQQGSTRLLTSSTGKGEATTTYDGYGNQIGSTGTASTPLGYDSQYTSSDTGLIYLRARTYDPGTAQFTSVDPMSKTTEAPYTYAADNPTNVMDLTGLAGAPTGLASCETFEEEVAKRQAEYIRERIRAAEFELARVKAQNEWENARERREVAAEMEDNPLSELIAKGAKVLAGCVVGGDVGTVAGLAAGASAGGPAGAAPGAAAGAVVGCVAGGVGAIISPVNPLEPSEGGP